MCPLYEYECESCKCTRDVLKKVGSDSAEVCDKCGKDMHRVIGASSFQVKGKGTCDPKFKV